MERYFQAIALDGADDLEDVPKLSFGRMISFFSNDPRDMSSDDDCPILIRSTARTIRKNKFIDDKGPRSVKRVAFQEPEAALDRCQLAGKTKRDGTPAQHYEPSTQQSNAVLPVAASLFGGSSGGTAPPAANSQYHYIVSIGPAFMSAPFGLVGLAGGS